MEGFCMRCKEKKEFEITEHKTYKTSRGEKHAEIGFCPECGTKIVAMVRKNA